MQARNDTGRSDGSRRSVLDLQQGLSEQRYNPVRKMSYVCLDVPSWDKARLLVDQFGSAVDGYKVGLELFHAEGPAVVERLCNAGKRVFLDVKLHDIPNTVAGALKSICQLPVEMVNVHALGGPDMLKHAREVVDNAPFQPLLIAVTILTSLNESVMGRLGFASSAAHTVEQLSIMAWKSGLDGVVASALEIPVIKKAVESAGSQARQNRITGDSRTDDSANVSGETKEFEIVVPGTRVKGSGHQDQARTLTPGEAVAGGASRLVLGRAVTQAENPLLALEQIWEEMLHAVPSAGRV
jgi:orotidine-5'-phosphate decarboxylase